MKMLRVASVSMGSILKHKVRAFLIILSVVVGIVALTVIVAMTDGANRMILKKIQNFGPDAVMVHSGGGKMRGPSTASEANLTKKDISDIRNLDTVKLVSPFQVSLDMPIKYGNQFTTSWVMGVEQNWQDAWRRGAVRGEFITDSDNEQLTKVCVIGQTAMKELFGTTDPIGEDILIENVSFKVVGVLKKVGQSPVGTDFDNLILIPFSTASRRLMNQPLYISMARVIVNNSSQGGKVAGQIKDILRANHHLAATEEDDFRLTTVEEISKMIKGTSQTLHLFLWLVAVIAPLVGGIVLMNIMLMAVGERMCEIGLRRALGAKKKHIVFQFLAESVFLTFTGGVIGVGLGAAVVMLLAHSGKPVSVSGSAFVMAFAFSVLIGLIFGIYPARKAAELDPAKAISQR